MAAFESFKGFFAAPSGHKSEPEDDTNHDPPTQLPKNRYAAHDELALLAQKHYRAAREAVVGTAPEFFERRGALFAADQHRFVQEHPWLVGKFLLEHVDAREQFLARARTEPPDEPIPAPTPAALELGRVTTFVREHPNAIANLVRAHEARWPGLAQALRDNPALIVTNPHVVAASLRASPDFLADALLAALAPEPAAYTPEGMSGTACPPASTPRFRLTVEQLALIAVAAFLAFAIAVPEAFADLATFLFDLN